jgi:stage II sporulation protein D
LAGFDVITEVRVFATFLVLLLASSLVAQVPASRRTDAEIAIGVLGLFRPPEVVVRPQTENVLVCLAEDQRLVVTAPLAVKLNGRNLDFGSRTIDKATLHCDDGQGNVSAFIVSVPGRISRHYIGKLELRAGSGQLIIVVHMDVETAVASIVAAESPAGAPMEALKAQAVATRSFLVAGKGRHRDFDFCDTTHCQFLRAPPPAQSTSVQAAAATTGLVLAYKERVFPALYSSSCGGRSHSLRELGLPVRDYPYFAVPCSYCQRHPERWASRIQEADAADLAATEHSRLQLARKLGWKAVPSNSYSSRHENGSIVLEGLGVGHGLGLCQRGAADMARNGASFLEILEHYYPNTAVLRLL